MKTRTLCLCATEYVQVGHKGPSKSTLFLWHPWNDSNFLHGLVWTIEGTMSSFFGFRRALHFLEFSQSKKADKWSDVSKLSYNVENCSNLACMRVMGITTNLQKLGSFQGCPNVDHVERRVFGYARRLCLRARCTLLKWSQFFSWPFMTNSRHHGKSCGFSSSFAFSGVFTVKKADNWPEVSQCAYDVRICLNLAWMLYTTTRACPPACKSSGHLSIVQKICSYL